MTYLLDTDVVSGLRRLNHLPRETAAWFASVPEDSLYISVITVMEIEIGIRRRERRDPAQGALLRRWKSEWVLPAFDGRVLDVTTEIAEACAAMHVPDPKPSFDSLIGATAIVHGFTLLTRNLADFPNMPIAKLDPWRPSDI